jgi:YD repeat-containing protein
LAADHRTNTINYVTSGPNLNLIASVTDPYGRSCALQYSVAEQLLSVTDVVGITSSLNYDATTGWPISLTTLSANFQASGHLFDLTEDDKQKGRQRHWLGGTVHGSAMAIDTLSLEIAPSHDGTTQGQKTWFDHANKDPQGTDWKGDQILPAVIARVLPDGTTWYVYFQRNSWGKPTSEESTYTLTGGGVGTRTRTFSYSADGIDLLQETDFSGNVVRSYTLHGTYPHTYASMTEYPAAGVPYTTSYTYDFSVRLLTLTTPAGLLSTYTYGTDGYVVSIVDSISGTPLRTNSYTWLHGDQRTHTDPRGLTRTFTHDGLGRLTRIDYPGDVNAYEEWR